VLPAVFVVSGALVYPDSLAAPDLKPAMVFMCGGLWRRPKEILPMSSKWVCRAKLAAEVDGAVPKRTGSAIWKDTAVRSFL
jgi:hypothetical protein